jgi:hypothetical protein
VPASAPDDLGAPLATRLDWIALHAECALGMRPAAGDRRRLGDELLPGLLAGLPARVRAALDVATILNV